ncbi:hypothetical protein BXZ70DRAFT_911436 [Cristinia sonorae]|uniref:Hydrophobin n=1 Tax=Cristinia sonorae TaxID=1940300 RepID=A0A8K0UCX7_9AGAR|nr:hypothetical protein BXZ70DRAFT_911436 [Cristinia sonorae]
MFHKIVLLAAVTAMGTLAYTPIIGPAQCGSGVLCCQAIIAPQTTISPLSDLAIFPPIGLVGAECKPLVIPLDLQNTVVPCTGIPACCPPNILETAPTPTTIKGVKVTAGCSIVDVDK